MLFLSMNTTNLSFDVFQNASTRSPEQIKTHSLGKAKHFVAQGNLDLRMKAS